MSAPAPPGLSQRELQLVDLVDEIAGVTPGLPTHEDPHLPAVELAGVAMSTRLPSLALRRPGPALDADQEFHCVGPLDAPGKDEASQPPWLGGLAGLLGLLPEGPFTDD
jgi:hypothetical protein